MDFDDQQLGELRKGNAAVYCKLVEQYEGPLYRYLLATTCDAQLASELTVDSFSDFFQAIPKMRGNVEDLRGFLFSVARNSLRRHWRRERHKTEPLELAREVSYAQPTPAKLVQIQEEHSQLLAALQQLDSQTREVFVLRFIEQLSVAQVAQAVDEPLGTVKSRIHRGRQRLEALLADQLSESKGTA